MRLAFLSTFIVLASVGSSPPLAQSAEPLSPEQAKVAFLKQQDRPKVPADVEEAKPTEKGKLVYSQWTFASEKKADGTVERVPVLTVSPAGAKGKLPVMIVLHGTGGDKEGVESWLRNFPEKRGVGGA